MTKPREDLTGRTFDRLTVMSYAGNRKWWCRCECGRGTLVFAMNIKRGNTASCGCLRRAESAARGTSHGMTGTHVYKTWLSMRARCSKPGGRAWDDYGARGIRVCPAWDDSLEAFYAHVGDPPTPRHTLDRIDNAKGYEPGNVRWATKQEQARNRSVCVAIEFQGKQYGSIAEFMDWLLPQINAKRTSIKRALVGAVTREIRQ
jgi:hypothetical protein